MEKFPPIALLVNTPQGALALNPERSRVSLPRGPQARESLILYGPYLEGLARFLSQDDYGPLRKALSLHRGQSVPLASIRHVSLISEKHGALYHVARVTVVLDDGACSFALNVAVDARQQAALESEFQLLEALHDRFELPYLPRVYLTGEASYTPGSGGRRGLALFMAEWFEGYCEFHLSVPPGGSIPVIKIWDLQGKDVWLNARQAQSLYRQAAAILTAYWDAETLKQIYPWHHAAGDFIVKPHGESVTLRLITVRGYRCLIASAPKFEENPIGMVHFFLNLTLRLRLDRLDGTGELTWADPDSLAGIVEGFLQAWEEKAKADFSLPSALEVLSLLRSFTASEWTALAELVLEDGKIEEDELQFIGPRLQAHAGNLVHVLEKAFDLSPRREHRL